MGNFTNILNKIKSYYNPPETYIIKTPRTKNGIDGRVVTYVDKHSYLTEQYKVLRTNLYSLSPQTPIKTILLTSTQAQEGKSVTACNLSYTMSLEAEKRTILVDTDLRRPSIHKLVGISRKPGFTDILNGEVPFEHFTKKPVLDNLYIIPSGTMISSPSEFLSSVKMKEVMDKLKSQFDHVIFDTPPVINVTDSCILGSVCDCVLLLVRAGVTPKNMVEESFTMLKHAQAKPKACILIATTVPPYYYYFSRYKYYYKYRYGYRADKETKTPPQENNQ